MNIDRRALIRAAAAWPALSILPALAEEKKLSPLNVVELRQYTLLGGRREELIELFEREFVAPQDALGAHVLGTFIDLDDPDRFVWLRGFESMEARAEALTAFYTGPVWRVHRDAANATMVDSDNVLLLRSMGGLPDPATPADREGGILTVYIHYLGRTEPGLFAEVFNQRLRPCLGDLGVLPLAVFVTEAAANNFPRLPVREGEPVFVWLARHADAEAAEAFHAKLAGLHGWRDGVPEAALSAFMRKPERLRLAPTRCSALR